MSSDFKDSSNFDKDENKLSPKKAGESSGIKGALLRVITKIN